MATINCPVCRRGDAQGEPDGKRGGLAVDCPVCAHYWISASLQAMLLGAQYEGKRHLISGATRRSWDAYGRRLELTTDAPGDRIEDVLAGIGIRKGPIQRIDLLVLAMYRLSSAGGASVKLDRQTSYPMVFAEGEKEFEYIRGEAVGRGLIRAHMKEGFVLTTSGWQRAEKLRGEVVDTDQAFVALMWDGMNDVYENGIRPALEEDTGWRARCVNWEEDNEKLDDLIIAEIRRSALVVADSTGQRPNVYFEAGFAFGLGHELIWMCKAGDEGKAAFDVRQYRHVVWENAGDLREKLARRIRAMGLERPRRRASEGGT